MAKAVLLDLNKISARVRALRLGLGYSQRDIASKGVTYAYISRIESKTRRPSIEALIALADKLGTTALDLMTGEPKGYCPVCQRGHSNGMTKVSKRDVDHLDKS